jgi:hypothetical protein
VIAGGAPERYPGENFFPASLEEVGFVSLAAGDYRLRPDSPLGGAATDGHDVGVVFDELLAVLGESAAQHRLLAPRVHQLRSSRR